MFPVFDTASTPEALVEEGLAGSLLSVLDKGEQEQEDQPEEILDWRLWVNGRNTTEGVQDTIRKGNFS